MASSMWNLVSTVSQSVQSKLDEAAGIKRAHTSDGLNEDSVLPPASQPSGVDHEKDPDLDPDDAAQNENERSLQSEVAEHSQENRLVAQLERFQQALVEREEAVLQLTEENNNLKLDAALFAEEIAELTKKLKSGDTNSKELAELKEREQQLIKEGQQMSAEVGRVRGKLKQLTADKKALEEKVEKLLSELSDYSSKEQQWNDARTVMMASDATAKERIAHLEQTVSSQAAELEKSSQLQATLKGQIAALTRELEVTNISRAKETSDEVAQLEERAAKAEEEVDRLKFQLRKSVVDSDRRIAAVEKELSLANERAHRAESKVLDSAQSATESAYVVQLELQQVQKQKEKVDEELQSLRKETAVYRENSLSLREQLAESERRLTLKLAEETNAVVELKKRCKAAEHALEMEKSKVTACERKISSLSSTLEDKSSELAEAKAALKASEHRYRELVASSMAAAAASPSSEGQQHGETTSLANHHGRSVIDVKELLMHRSPRSPRLPAQHPPPSGVAGGRVGANRTERELARCTAQLEELRGVQQELVATRHQLEALALQHDTLLQMYGQKEEELEDAAADMACAKRVYKEQIDVLANRVMELQTMMTPRRNL